MYIFLLLFSSTDYSALAWLCYHTTALKNAILHNQSIILQYIQKTETQPISILKHWYSLW